jgi:RNA polymerase sigma factor (sigma-70 family)
MKNDSLRYLKDRLAPDVIKVVDPNNHGVEEILSSYFLLIVWLARRYVRPMVELEDIVDEGVIGLLDAIRRFDPARATGKNAFHNLAIIRIKHYMFEYLLRNSSTYHVPTYMARAMTLVDRARIILNSHMYDGDPETDLQSFGAPHEKDHFPQDARDELREVKETLQKLAKNSGKTYEEMVAGVLRIQYNIGAFENGGPGEGEEVSEVDIASREYLGKFLNGLSNVARDVMYLRLEGNTLEDTGKAMGFTRERARQVEAATVNWFQKTRMFKEASDDE